MASLYGLLYESLAAENRQRLAHMEQALDRLDETLARLAVQRNALRQEKIVEEIEVPDQQDGFGLDWNKGCSSLQTLFLAGHGLIVPSSNWGGRLGFYCRCY